MRLSRDDFLRVIAATPLVSIDLVIRKPGGEVLVGLRRNRPARDSWFVPGGRIYKGETLEQAFSRTVEAEVGASWELEQASSLGNFTHIYPDNALEEAHVGTHYVVLAYQVDVAEDFLPRQSDQHNEWRWVKLADYPDFGGRGEAYPIHSNCLPYL